MLSSLTLPIFTPLFFYVGISCAGAQLVLTLIFAYALGDGPWRAEPAFTAHQVVCIPLLLWLTYTGWSHWLASDIGASPAERALGVHPVGYEMSQVVLAMMLFWDIPSGLMIKVLREPLMLAHHIGMALVALLGFVPLFSHYATFFFGVIELSGIVLCFVDVFHPKHREYCDWLATMPKLSKLNDLGRGIFFLLYMVLRAVLFPYVIFTSVVADYLSVLQLSQADPKVLRGVPLPLLTLTPAAGVLFAFLQVYWGWLLIKQVRKLLAPPAKDGKAL